MYHLNVQQDCISARFPLQCIVPWTVNLELYSCLTAATSTDSYVSAKKKKEPNTEYSYTYIYIIFFFFSSIDIIHFFFKSSGLQLIKQNTPFNKKVLIWKQFKHVQSMKKKEEEKKQFLTKIVVEICHIERKIGNILPILHVYSDLVRKVRHCQTPPPPLFRKIRNWLPPPSSPRQKKIGWKMKGNLIKLVPRCGG